MDVTITSSREFTDTLRRYATGSSHIFRDVLNGRALDIAIKSYKYTRVADKAKIEQRFGVVGYRVSRSRKTGAFKKRKAIFGGRITSEGKIQVYAELLVNYRRKKRGLPLVWGKQLETAARRMLSAVIRSIGFIRSGWIPAMASLTVAKKAFTDEGTNLNAGALNKQIRGQLKGYCRPAITWWNPQVEFGNTTKVAEPISRDAVDRAFRESIARMEYFINKGMEQAWQDAGGNRTIK